MSRTLPLLLSGLAFAALATLCNGLVFGLGDHAISEVFVGGSTVFAGDLLDGAGRHHPSILWGLLAALRGLGSWGAGSHLSGAEPESAALGGPVVLLSHLLHLGALAATGAAIHAFVTTLRPDGPRWAPWLALALFAPGHVVLGGAPTLDALLLPRGVALPLELWAFALLADRRPHAALLLAGLALPLHAPSGLPTLLAVGFSAWRERAPSGRLRPFDLLLPALPGLLVAGGLLVLPAFADLFTTGSPSGGSAPSVATACSAAGLASGGMAVAVQALSPAPADVQTIVAARLAHHLAPQSAGLGDFAVLAILGIVGNLALRGALSSVARRLQTQLAALLSWTVLAGAASSLLAVPMLWNLEPWQGARLVVPLVVCAIASAATARTALPMLALVALSWGSSPSAWWAPSGAEGDEAALAAWARESTAPGDLFVLPPDGFEGFRTLAQRPVFALWKDGGEAQFDAAFARRWGSRMESLCRCAPFAGELPDEDGRGSRSRTLSERVGRGYDQAADELVAATARGAGARWLVRRTGSIPPRLEGRLPVARAGALAVYAVEPAPVELPKPRGRGR